MMGEAKHTARVTPRVVGLAAETPTDNRWCTCCEATLKGRVAWLELDQRSDTYHDYGGIPADKSQGWFPFGLTCARVKLNEHRAAIAKATGGTL